MNLFVFSGNVGKDPETLETPGGKSFVKASLAVKDPYADEDTPPMWIDFTVWGKSAENFANIVGKGDKVLITGTIKKRVVDSDGTKVTYYDFYANEWELQKKADGGGGQSSGQSKSKPAPKGKTPAKGNYQF